MLNQWPSVCCEGGERFSAALLAKSHSLRCDSSAGQTHTHSLQTAGHDCRNYYWPFFHRIRKYFNKQSLYLGALSFMSYFRNKKLTHTSGLGSWQHPHCTFSVPLLRTPWILSLEFYIHPRNRGFTYITARLLTPHRQLLLSKESWLPSERWGWGLSAFSAHPHEHLKGHIQNHHKQQQRKLSCRVTEAKWTQDWRAGWGGRKVIETVSWDILGHSPELWRKLAGKL